MVPVITTPDNGEMVTPAGLTCTVGHLHDFTDMSGKTEDTGISTEEKWAVDFKKNSP